MRISFWPNAAQSWPDILTLARHAEQGGWDGLWVADHFMPNQADNSGPVHEVWSLLAALAALVPRVRIGSLVLGNTYRHPAVVANMAASLDHVSGGRLVLGMGAGWQENEHAAYGLEFYTMPERLKRLEEACVVIRSLLGQPRSTLDGRYYQLRDAPLAPKPVHGHIPLLIGGGGEKVTLRIVARHADEWNVWATVPRYVEKAAILAEHCARAERDPATIERSAVALVTVSDDAATVQRVRAEPQARQAIAGSVSELQDILGAYAAAGVDEFIVPDFNLPAGAPAEKLEWLDRFIEDVAPVVR